MVDYCCKFSWNLESQKVQKKKLQKTGWRWNPKSRLDSWNLDSWLQFGSEDHI